MSTSTTTTTITTSVSLATTQQALFGTESAPASPVRVKREAPRSIGRSNTGILHLPPTLIPKPLQEGKAKSSREQLGDRSYQISVRRASGGERHPHVITVEIPISTFLDFIPIPVISPKKWREGLSCTLEHEALQSDFSSDEKKNIIQGLYNRSLEYSSILQRIQKTIEAFGRVKRYEFLKQFSQETNPLRFSERYGKLCEKSRYQGDVLFHIAGAEQALHIIQSASDLQGEVLKRKLDMEFDRIAFVETKRKNLLNSSFVFEKKFDVENPQIIPIPIFLLDYKEFAETFRSYYSKGPFPADALVINGKNIPIPNYATLQIEEEKGEEFFQEWLIAILQQELNIKAALSEREQIALFASEASDVTFSPRSSSGKEKRKKKQAKLKKSIKAHLAQEFKTPCGDLYFKMTEFLTKLSKEKQTLEFAQQMLPHSYYLSKYLRSHPAFAEKKWDEVADELYRIYCRTHQLQKKYQEIPLLALLKSLCYSVFGTAGCLLDGTICPSLSMHDDGLAPRLCATYSKPKKVSVVRKDVEENISDSLALLKAFPSSDNENDLKFRVYQLQHDHAFIGSYRVEMVGKFFEVTHIKAFDILRVETSKEPEETPVASGASSEKKEENKKKAHCFVHWVIKGELGSIDHSAEMRFADFVFPADCLYPERKIIMDKFHLEWRTCPWGHYLKRNDIVASPSGSL